MGCQNLDHDDLNAARGVSWATLFGSALWTALYSLAKYLN